MSVLPAIGIAHPMPPVRFHPGRTRSHIVNPMHMTNRNGRSCELAALSLTSRRLLSCGTIPVRPGANADRLQCTRYAVRALSTVGAAHEASLEFPKRAANGFRDLT